LSQTVDPARDRQTAALALRLPVALVVFLFTASYPALDFATASKPTDIGLGMFLVYAGIALVTAILVFGLLLPRMIPRAGAVPVALALSVVGTVLAPGFFTGFPPALAAGGALLGWSATKGTRQPRLAWAAAVIGVIGVLFAVLSYVTVFV